MRIIAQRCDGTVLDHGCHGRKAVQKAKEQLEQTGIEYSINLTLKLLSMVRMVDMDLRGIWEK